MSEPYVKRKRGMFYSPNNAGYTTEIWAAGFYTLEDAMAEAAHQPGIVTYAPVSAYRADAVRNLEIAKSGLERIDRAIANWDTPSEGPSKTKLAASPDAAGGPIHSTEKTLAEHITEICERDRDPLR